MAAQRGRIRVAWQNKTVLAVIPARGNSKGIPRKNLCTVGGISLIAHTARVAKALSWLDAAVLSTDDDEMAEEGRRCGLDVPFRRPADLATDIRIRTALRWTLGRLYLLGPPSLFLATFGFLLFFIPNRTTGFIAKLSGADDAEISTWKLLIGMVLYSLWVGILSVLVGFTFGTLAGVSMLLFSPIVGASGLWLREKWLGASEDIQLFFRVRGRSNLIEGLRRRQTEIANRMWELVRYL